jgi:hypothetical protein
MKPVPLPCLALVALFTSFGCGRTIEPPPQPAHSPLQVGSVGRSLSDIVLNPAQLSPPQMNDIEAIMFAVGEVKGTRSLLQEISNIRGPFERFVIVELFSFQADSGKDEFVGMRGHEVNLLESWGGRLSLLVLYQRDGCLGYVTNLAPPDLTEPSVTPDGECQGYRSVFWQPDEKAKTQGGTFAATMDIWKNIRAPADDSLAHPRFRLSMDSSLMTRITVGDESHYSTAVRLNLSADGFEEAAFRDAYKVWGRISRDQMHRGSRYEK